MIGKTTTEIVIGVFENKLKGDEVWLDTEQVKVVIKEETLRMKKSNYLIWESCVEEIWKRLFGDEK